jgi:hypothetical protein
MLLKAVYTVSLDTAQERQSRINTDIQRHPVWWVEYPNIYDAIVSPTEMCMYKLLNTILMS